jgi:hypothetical protein
MAACLRAEAARVSLHTTRSDQVCGCLIQVLWGKKLDECAFVRDMLCDSLTIHHFCVCVCVCERERKKERERESVCVFVCV